MCVRERERERGAFGVLTFIFLWRLRGILLLFLLYREFRFRRPLEEARGADVAGRGNGKARERQRRGVSFGFFRIFIILPLLQVCLGLFRIFIILPLCLLQNFSIHSYNGASERHMRAHTIARERRVTQRRGGAFL